MILMQQNIEYMIGSMEETVHAKPLPVFDRNVIELLDDVSKEILKIRNVREFEDLVSIAFWIRKASLIKMKQQYETKDRLGYGLMFQCSFCIRWLFLYWQVMRILSECHRKNLSREESFVRRSESRWRNIRPCCRMSACCGTDTTKKSQMSYL